MVDDLEYIQHYQPETFTTGDAPDLGGAVDQKPSRLPICSCERCSAMDSEFKKPAKFAGYSRINPYKAGVLTNHQYFICCRDTYAFVFKIREWSESVPS